MFSSFHSKSLFKASYFASRQTILVCTSPAPISFDWCVCIGLAGEIMCEGRLSKALCVLVHMCVCVDLGIVLYRC